MARLVLLSEGYTGRTFDLKVEQTTVGRVPDNAIEIPDGSISSHHGEFILKGQDVIFRDLCSTNGSFVGNEKVTEVTLKHGMVLRLGQIDMRFESEVPTAKTSSRPPAHTAVIPGGINREQLATTSAGATAVKHTEFKKKSNTSTTVFLAVLGAVVLILVVILAMVIMGSTK